MGFRLHHREEEDFSKVLGAGEEHDESVDADSAAAGWGHSAFQGVEELFVHGVGFIIAFAALAELLFKPFALVDGVVDFAECVANFSAEDIAFESAGESGSVGVFFGEG